MFSFEQEGGEPPPRKKKKCANNLGQDIISLAVSQNTQHLLSQPIMYQMTSLFYFYCPWIIGVIMAEPVLVHQRNTLLTDKDAIKLSLNQMKYFFHSCYLQYKKKSNVNTPGLLYRQFLSKITICTIDYQKTKKLFIEIFWLYIQSLSIFNRR